MPEQAQVQELETQVFRWNAGVRHNDNSLINCFPVFSISAVTSGFIDVAFNFGFKQICFQGNSNEECQNGIITAASPEVFPCWSLQYWILINMPGYPLSDIHNPWWGRIERFKSERAGIIINSRLRFKLDIILAIVNKGSKYGQHKLFLLLPACCKLFNKFFDWCLASP